MMGINTPVYNAPEGMDNAIPLLWRVPKRRGGLNKFKLLNSTSMAAFNLNIKKFRCKNRDGKIERYLSTVVGLQ